MRKMYFVGAGLFIGFMCFAIIVSGARLTQFINLPSFIMVAGCTFVLLLANFNLREMGRAFTVGFRKKEESPEDLKKGYIFFKSMRLYLIISGLLGTITGAMAMLVNLRDSSRIGNGVSLAILTLLYGIVFSTLITIPFTTGIKKRLIEQGESLSMNE